MTTGTAVGIRSELETKVLNVAGTLNSAKLKNGMNILFCRIKELIDKDCEIISIDIDGQKRKLIDRESLKTMDAMHCFLRIVVCLDDKKSITAIRNNRIITKSLACPKIRQLFQ